MASRYLYARLARRTAQHAISTRSALRRPFHSTASSRLAAAAGDATVVVPQPVVVRRRPVGAFRSGLLGFLAGSTLTGFGVYYYVLEEYKVANEMLMEDIYSLQAAVQRVNTYVQSLEEKLTEVEKKTSKS